MNSCFYYHCANKAVVILFFQHIVIFQFLAWLPLCVMSLPFNLSYEMMNIICHLVNIGLLWVSRSGISSTVSNRAQAYVTVSGDSRPPDTNISAHSAQQHSGSHSNKSVCFFFCLFVCFMDPPAASSHPAPDKTEFDAVEGFCIKPVDFFLKWLLSRLFLNIFSPNFSKDSLIYVDNKLKAWC